MEPEKTPITLQQSHLCSTVSRFTLKTRTSVVSKSLRNAFLRELIAIVCNEILPNIVSKESNNQAHNKEKELA